MLTIKDETESNEVIVIEDVCDVEEVQELYKILCNKDVVISQYQIPFELLKEVCKCKNTDAIILSRNMFLYFYFKALLKIYKQRTLEHIMKRVINPVQKLGALVCSRVQKHMRSLIHPLLSKYLQWSSYGRVETSIPEHSNIEDILTTDDLDATNLETVNASQNVRNDIILLSTKISLTDHDPPLIPLHDVDCCFYNVDNNEDTSMTGNSDALSVTFRSKHSKFQRKLFKTYSEARIFYEQQSIVYSNLCLRYCKGRRYLVQLYSNNKGKHEYMFIPERLLKYFNSLSSIGLSNINITDVVSFPADTKEEFVLAGCNAINQNIKEYILMLYNLRKFTIPKIHHSSFIRNVYEFIYSHYEFRYSQQWMRNPVSFDSAGWELGMDNGEIKNFASILGYSASSCEYIRLHDMYSEYEVYNKSKFRFEILIIVTFQVFVEILYYMGYIIQDSKVMHLQKLEERKDVKLGIVYNMERHIRNKYYKTKNLSFTREIPNISPDDITMISPWRNSSLIM